MTIPTSIIKLMLIEMTVLAVVMLAIVPPILAKVAEHFDGEIFKLTNGLVAGQCN